MGVEYYIKNSTNTTDVFYSDTLYTFSKSKKLNKGLFLFGMVKRDFDIWKENNPSPVFLENYKANFVLRKPTTSEKVFSYDINHAYWRIAYIKGYISEKTYNHGIRLKAQGNDMKEVYCMALSTQGQTKTLKASVKGFVKEKKMKISKDVFHRDIYNDIRNSTYAVMDELAHELGNDFLNYNVDCISFAGEHNIQKVEEYFKNKNLQIKPVKTKN